jgi:hypothetical protein
MIILRAPKAPAKREIAGAFFVLVSAKPSRVRARVMGAK